MKQIFKTAVIGCLCYINTLHVLAQPKITRVEYFVDTDPGYGKATALPITPGPNLANLSFTIDITSFAQGLHVVGVRSQDSVGAWSIDKKWLFLKPYSSGAAPTRSITALEYYFDTDPGYGKGISVSVSPAVDINNLTVNADLSGMSAGKHSLVFRSQDDQKAWSLNYVDSFTLSNNVPMPVTMLYFKAQKAANTARLNWATSQETNSKVFLVQRSMDGTNFSVIGSVTAAGNSSMALSYGYDDDISLLSNTDIYYRLQEVDIDGSSTYSSIAVVSKNDQAGLFSLLQNPVQSTATLLYTAFAIETVTIALTDINGKTVYTKAATTTAGINNLNINMIGLTKGIYLIQAISPNGRQTFKLIKE